MSFFDPEQEDKLKEECGVFGIYNPDGSAAAPSIYYGLSALQHRGQEACGIAVCNTNGPKGNITWHKDMGLVSEVFHEESLDSLKGNIGIGHVPLLHDRRKPRGKCAVPRLKLFKRHACACP